MKKKCLIYLKLHNLSKPYDDRFYPRTFNIVLNIKLENMQLYILLNLFNLTLLFKNLLFWKHNLTKFAI